MNEWREYAPSRHEVRERLLILRHIEAFQIPRRKVCRYFGIARATPYRWHHKIEEQKPSGTPANKTPTEIASLVREITKANLSWGRIRGGGTGKNLMRGAAQSATIAGSFAVKVGVLMPETHWELYSHPSDIGIRGFGPTREEAFAQAAVALTSVITDVQKVQPKQAVEIACREEDNELLFFCWLSSLLYEMDTRGMLFSRFEVEAIEGGIRARAWGEPVEVARHEPAVEVKAATYADLKVEQRADGEWIAQCIVDV